MSKKLKIKLLPNGEIEMETLGIKGKKCLDYAEIIKKMVNGTISKTEITQEYYESDTEISTTNDNVINLD